MRRNIRIWIASNNTHGAYYTATTDTLDIVQIAQKYGRAESGEIVQLIEVDGAELEIPERETASWNGQYREYMQVGAVYEND